MRAGEAGSQWLQRDLKDISRDFNAWPLFGCWLKQTNFKNHVWYYETMGEMTKINGNGQLIHR